MTVIVFLLIYFSSSHLYPGKSLRNYTYIDYRSRHIIVRPVMVRRYVFW